MLDSEHSSQEDVLLQTTNSKIHCGVWVDNDDAEWKEPVRIRAKTSNAKVRLDVVCGTFLRLFYLACLITVAFPGAFGPTLADQIY